MERGEILWEPTRDSALDRFANGRSYADLYEWSIDDLEGFWSAVADFCDVRWHAPPTRMLADRTMPGARWCPGGELSYAEEILRLCDRWKKTPSEILDEPAESWWFIEVERLGVNFDDERGGDPGYG